MKTTLQWTIDCSYMQKVYSKYTCLGGFIRKEADQSRTYDAFSNQFLIPSLVSLTEKKKRANSIKSWISIRFLTVTDGWGYRESIDDFWSRAQEFVSLWRLYGAVLNCDLDKLKDVVVFMDMVYPFNVLHKSKSYLKQLIENRDDGTRHYKACPCDMYNKTATIEDINKDPSKYYQAAVFRYITYAIEERLELTLRQTGYFNQCRSITSDGRQDHYKVVPCLQPKNLLQALYLQFYLMLGDRNKKICASCGCVFTPTRRDVRYCSDKCKQREKMRRYRARKQKGGRN